MKELKSQSGDADPAPKNTPKRAQGEPWLYLAGCTVPAGTYLRIKTGKTIRLACEGVLPASYDGSVAVYQRQAETWADVTGQDNAGIEHDGSEDLK